MAERDIFKDYIRQSTNNQNKASISVNVEDYIRKINVTTVQKPNENTADISKGKSLVFDLVIENGNVIIPDERVRKTNVYIKAGKIFAIGDIDGVEAKRTIDASGKYVSPGIIDPHTHLGLFARLDEDMRSETRAALIGGVTTTGVFIGGEKSHFDTISEFEKATKTSAYTDILPHLVIGNELQVEEMKYYANHLGVTSFKIYLNGIPGLIKSVDDGFILDVFEQIEIIRNLGKTGIVCCHAENSSMIERALRNTKEKLGDEATISEWAKTHPKMAEEEAILRLSYLSKKCKVPVYLVHISSKEGVASLKKERAFNPYLYAETTSPYLSLDGKSLDSANFKMEPPIRDREDKEALWEAIEEDVIDTIGTDNVCQTLKEKNAGAENIWEVIPGYSAIEEHLSAVITEGIIKRGLDIERVITHMTKNPAKTFGVYPKKGTILPGSDADIIIFDIDSSKIVDSKDNNSRSDFSIYEGRRHFGKPLITIKNGRVVCENGRLTNEEPLGEIIKR